VATPPEMDDLYSRIHRNTRASYLKNQKQQQNIFGINPEVAELAAEKGMGITAGTYVSTHVEAASALETWEDPDFYDDYHEDNYGDYYQNYGNMPISIRTGGAIDPETGEVIPITPASFSDADDAYTQAPTPTSNPERPRTVAAAFELERNVLTLIFRDGTIYNYYEVTVSEWKAFRNRATKWEYIRDVLDAKPRGVADTSSLTPEIREFAYRQARTAQISTAKRTGWKKPEKRSYNWQSNINKPNRRRKGTNPYG
jgi:hypothetical protein